MSEFAIRVEGLSKQYKIGEKQASYKTLRDLLSAPFKLDSTRSLFGRRNGSRREHSNGHNSFWALKDVSFEVKPGEVLGIIGRNGAGKSTLLKILSRITEPTQGYADIVGRVGSLLEIGTGFHPELTGRENIYLSGAILGMKRKELARKFDEIVAFAEVEQFVDTPVKHYSSGMYLRLAFAVAAHLETEILLVDEVLAVGDAAFQQKCLGKMQDVAEGGRTVLFVSHNMGAVQTLCQKGTLLEQGQMQFFGDIEECTSMYLATAARAVHFRRTSAPTAKAYIQEASFVSSNAVKYGESVQIQVAVIATAPMSVSLDWRLKTEYGVPIVWGCSQLQLGQVEMLQEGRNEFTLDIGPLSLSQGTYPISLELEIPWTEYLDRVEDCLTLELTSCSMGSKFHSIRGSQSRGAVIFPYRWDWAKSTSPHQGEIEDDQ